MAGRVVVVLEACIMYTLVDIYKLLTEMEAVIVNFLLKFLILIIANIKLVPPKHINKKQHFSYFYCYFLIF